ncbi:MAG: hypothetical protein ACK5HM_09790 [Gemmatimonas sp.]|uniref:hypothetical protein n=1 Tax=Gemmatimonas sp. TaxID=1962908 RepID=UPI00391C7D78
MGRYSTGGTVLSSARSISLEFYRTDALPGTMEAPLVARAKLRAWPPDLPPVCICLHDAGA